MVRSDDIKRMKNEYKVYKEQEDATVRAKKAIEQKGKEFIQQFLKKVQVDLGMDGLITDSMTASLADAISDMYLLLTV